MFGLAIAMEYTEGGNQIFAAAILLFTRYAKADVHSKSNSNTGPALMSPLSKFFLTYQPLSLA